MEEVEKQSTQTQSLGMPMEVGRERMEVLPELRGGEESQREVRRKGRLLQKNGQSLPRRALGRGQG